MMSARRRTAAPPPAAPDPTPRPAGTGATGVANVDADAGADADADANDEDDAWRHDPVAPVDEANPLKSVGRAIADTVTGGNAAGSQKPKR
jgi:hypothetical protein